MNLSEVDVLVLAGGKGTRLKSAVKNKPKPLADISGRPFLDILIADLKKNGFRRVIVCTGYMAEKIHKYYQKKNVGMEMEFSREQKPLGTGGAVKNARKFIRSREFLVMNGDSFAPIDYERFFEYHLKTKALATIALAKMKDSAGDFGNIKKNRSGRITEFREKAASKNAWVNAGVYIFSEKIMDLIPSNKFFSLEYGLLPGLHNCFGFPADDAFVDIGSPAGLKKARAVL